MDKNKRIKATVERLGLAEKIVFSYGELEQIAKESKCSLHDVMKYLRFGR